MKTKPKVFFIAPALSMGGMERASVNTANGLHDQNCEVIFLSLFKKEHFFKLNPKIKLIEPEGFNITSLSFMKSISWIRKEVKAYKPDSVIVFNKLYGALVALALKGIDIPFYLSERSSPLFHWKFPFNIINKVAYEINPPQGVIAQTQIAADYQKKYFKKSEVKVIPNILRSIEVFPEIQREYHILAVGRLNDYLKGFDLLLEAFTLLNNQTWELHIAGGDENGEALKQQASKLGISDRVKFLGKVKNIDPVYAKAGLFVIPSRSEGFPNALAEAMAAGCCCVAFDFIAGPRDMITDNKNGVIVPEGDIRALAIAMDDLIKNANKRHTLGENAQQIKIKLNQKVIIERIKQFINAK
ncbi:Glycosyltransferase involved in cell wall bisynthesis [Psychroflexus salarius]|uniref:Glycosyltransferase involved in cell wall bisynthesis n=1 Tax=Psychroflexus salarius TaxID=1155689 RepID=A0A1M4V673_9FLAO|nr:glycosyltransferase [Psychroflexus salarius]SHE64373.1 Glycosyltransferase involved in cell wall bisynthesis [Psychroflexus salarius]